MMRTRMHSSRIRTVHNSSHLLEGVPGPRGVSAPWGVSALGVPGPRSVCSWGGCLLQRGVSAPGGCLLPVGEGWWW